MSITNRAFEAAVASPTLCAVNPVRPARKKAMVKIAKQHDRVKYFKCEVCLKNIAIEYYFTVGDSIVCNDCNTEYVLHSKNPLELVRQEPDYSKLEYDDSY
jgi:hypothetical protein